MTGAPPTVRLAGQQYVTRVLYMTDPPARDAAVQHAVPGAIRHLLAAADERGGTVDWSTLRVQVLVPPEWMPYDASPLVAVVAEADARLPVGAPKVQADASGESYPGESADLHAARWFA